MSAIPPHQAGNLADCSQGIGQAFVSALAQTGAKKIYILGRRLEKLQESAKALDPTGDVVLPAQCDVTDQASIAAVVKRIEEEVGWVDVLINNSGIDGPNNRGIYNAKSIAELQEVLLKEWDLWPATMATNVTAVVGMSTLFLPLLEKANTRKGWQAGRLEDGKERARDMKTAAEGVEESDKRLSQIITTTSISGFNRHVTAGVAYTASKSAANMLGKSMATFLAPFGIRSNVIAPGSKCSRYYAVHKHC